MYFDNAATTFPKPECVYKTMDEINRSSCVNAGRGSYKLAKKATSIIDELKLELVNLVHLQDCSKVILTPSITIAINQIINGIRWEKGDNVYITPFEHNAIARTVNYISNKFEVNIEEIPVHTESLEIDVEALRYLFTIKQPKCVCVNHISNVNGYILPIDKVFVEAKKYDAITILDTAQSLGLLDINLSRTYADFVAFAGHKSLYGPLGIGGFIYNCNYPLTEFIVGGTGSDSLNLNMPEGIPVQYESSSQNIVAIAGLLEAIKWNKVIPDIYDKEKQLTDYLVEQLSTVQEVKLYIPMNREKHIGIVSMNVAGYTSDELGQILDTDFDISVRTGYHCAPFIHRLLKDDTFKGTVRISIGYYNTKEEINYLVDAIREIAADY